MNIQGLKEQRDIREYVAQQLELWGHAKSAHLIRGNVYARREGLDVLSYAHVTKIHYEKLNQRSFDDFYKEMKAMVERLPKQNARQDEGIELYRELNQCAECLYGDNRKPGWMKKDLRFEFCNEIQGFDKQVNYEEAKRDLIWFVGENEDFKLVLNEWERVMVLYYQSKGLVEEYKRADNRLSNCLMDLCE